VTKRIIYDGREGSGYPDELDLSSTLRFVYRKRVPVGVEHELFQDFRASYDWFRLVREVLHNYGKHEFVNAAQVKEMAQQFLGHHIKQDAFLAAVHLHGIKIRGEQKPFKDQSIKVPDLSRLPEALPLWNKYVQEQNPIQERKREKPNAY
jgi:hypothetical protein